MVGGYPTFVLCHVLHKQSPNIGLCFLLIVVHTMFTSTGIPSYWQQGVVLPSWHETAVPTSESQLVRPGLSWHTSCSVWRRLSMTKRRLKKQYFINILKYLRKSGTKWPLSSERNLWVLLCVLLWVILYNIYWGSCGLFGDHGNTWSQIEVFIMCK